MVLSLVVILHYDFVKSFSKVTVLSSCRFAKYYAFLTEKRKPVPFEVTEISLDAMGVLTANFVGAGFIRQSCFCHILVV